MSIKDVDKGLRALLYRAGGSGPKKVSVGVFGDAQGDRARIATFHEFGTDRIPARSFLRSWVDTNRSAIDAKLRAGAERVVAGTMTQEQVLQQIGAWIAAGIQKQIASGIAPELAESTIRQKRSSRALIDTGLLRSSITFKVGE